MADTGLGLVNYGAAQEQERQRQIEETKQIQYEIQRQSAQSNFQAQSGGGGSQGGFGSFMGGMSGQIDPSKLQGMFGGGQGAGGVAGAGNAGGATGSGGGSGWGLGSIFGGGGSAAGAGGSSAASGAASSGGGGMAAAGPWAALAALVVTNEDNARKGGYRDKDKGDYAKDLIGGKVLEQDLNQRWLPKLYGKDLKNDKTGVGHEQKAVGEFMTGDFKNGFKALENGTIGKFVKKIF